MQKPSSSPCECAAGAPAWPCLPPAYRHVYHPADGAHKAATKRALGWSALHHADINLLCVMQVAICSGPCMVTPEMQEENRHAPGWAAGGGQSPWARQQQQCAHRCKTQIKQYRRSAMLLMLLTASQPASRPFAAAACNVSVVSARSATHGAQLRLLPATAPHLVREPMMGGRLCPHRELLPVCAALHHDALLGRKLRCEPAEELPAGCHSLCC